MRTSRCTAISLACAALLCAGHAAAMPQDYGYARSAYADPAPLAPDPDGFDLQAGEFAWLPGSELRSDAPVTLLVSLRDQRAYVYRDGVRIAVTTVSTGKPGNDTPTGVFPITEKKKTHFSKKYDNAPMPWMQRLTQWGHALHAGNVRPTPASHGCIRLPAAFAQQLFSLTRRGDLVLIAQDPSMQSLERAGIDSQQAALVGLTSRRRPPAERVLVDGRTVTTSMQAAAPTGTSF